MGPKHHDRRSVSATTKVAAGTMCLKKICQGTFFRKKCRPAATFFCAPIACFKGVLALKCGRPTPPEPHALQAESRGWRAALWGPNTMLRGLLSDKKSGRWSHVLEEDLSRNFFFAKNAAHRPLFFAPRSPVSKCVLALKCGRPTPPTPHALQAESRGWRAALWTPNTMLGG